MFNLFNESQESISKNITKRYVMEQHNSIINALRNNELVSSITDIFSYVYDNNIMKMYNEFVTFKQSESE